MADDLVCALADLREEEALEIVKRRLAGGDTLATILADVTRAMELVGKRFSEKEYFLPDLVFAGEITGAISALVDSPGKTSDERKPLGSFVLGTVAGDVHDLGKDIVKFMLDVNGFDVHDLGVDVPPQRFVEEVRATGAQIVGLSGLLTLAVDSMKETVEALRAAGLRDGVRIIIGGPQVDEQIRLFSGADAYCNDAVSGVALAKRWAEESR